jgi:5-methylcytosine-specific restriction endonuclease McrA
MSVFPLSTLTWQDAVKSVFKKKVFVVAEYDERIPTANPKNSIPYPSVVVSKTYHPASQYAAFNRENIWFREKGHCAYCRGAIHLTDLTFDHVVPRSKGGDTSWDNIVAACEDCNKRKANMSLKDSRMVLAVTPRQPTTWELAKNARAMGKYAPPLEAWEDWMYWKSEILP